MKSLKQLLNTKAPSQERLLDIAILLSIIPHLFVMKSFMILYMLIALIFILKKEKSDKDRYILMAIGFILIAISFFNNYNFSNFSRIQFFVSLVSSLLIYAVTLQRVTREINIYLKISPALLMLLSFFFFESISMLVYSIFVLFVFCAFKYMEQNGCKTDRRSKNNITAFCPLASGGGDFVFSFSPHLF